MAKSQVTEQDLEKGLESLGGFGNLGTTPKARRDSPFGSDFAKKSETEVKPAPVAPPIVTKPAEKQVVEMPLAKKVEVLVEENREEVKPAPKVVAPKKTPPPLPQAKVESHAKSETLTERITLQMSPEMRDEVNDVARQLQRGRREKGERITANTLMRVAIEALLQNFDPKDGAGVSSEEELLEVVSKKLR